MKIGTLALKIAGRDGNNWCVIVDKIDDNYVLIDGNVRRKKCNIKHLEATEKILKIKKGASTDEVRKVLDRVCDKYVLGLPQGIIAPNGLNPSEYILIGRSIFDDFGKTDAVLKDWSPLVTIEIPYKGIVLEIKYRESKTC